MLRINRCVCMDRSFEELKRLAAENGWDFNELRNETRCGTACGLCVPYIRVMLKNGQTEFVELIREEPRVPARKDAHRSVRSPIRTNESCAG